MFFIILATFACTLTYNVPIIKEKSNPYFKNSELVEKTHKKFNDQKIFYRKAPTKMIKISEKSI